MEHVEPNETQPLQKEKNQLNPKKNSAPSHTRGTAPILWPAEASLLFSHSLGDPSPEMGTREGRAGVTVSSHHPFSRNLGNLWNDSQLQLHHVVLRRMVNSTIAILDTKADNHDGGAGSGDRGGALPRADSAVCRRCAQHYPRDPATAQCRAKHCARAGP
jgi:hypothetical protein